MKGIYEVVRRITPTIPTARKSRKLQYVKHSKSGIWLCVADEICSPRIIREIRKGTYEEREMLFASRLIDPGDRVLELGAGLGFLSTVICKSVMPDFYAAVEADPRLIPYINRTHEKNNVTGVKIIQAAFVTDKKLLEDGSVDFGITKAFWGSGIDKANTVGVTTVKVPTQDASFFIKVNKINSLICDIEGGELSLLKGLNLEGVQKIILETHPKLYGQSGLHKIFKILTRHDFVYNAPNSGGPVVSFERIGTGDYALPLANY